MPSYPGDTPSSFRPGVQNPAADLTRMAEQVRESSTLIAEPPLQADPGPYGTVLRFVQEPDRLARLDTQDTGGANQWAWTEMQTRPDGTVMPLDGGMVTTAAQKYAVPVTGSGSANQLGIVRPKGDFYEFVPAAGGGLTWQASQAGPTTSDQVITTSATVIEDVAASLQPGEYLVFARAKADVGTLVNSPWSADVVAGLAPSVGDESFVTIYSDTAGAVVTGIVAPFGVGGGSGPGTSMSLIVAGSGTYRVVVTGSTVRTINLMGYLLVASNAFCHFRRLFCNLDIWKVG